MSGTKKRHRNPKKRRNVFTKKTFLHGIVVRLYLSKERKNYCNRLCGCTRFLWNKVLEYKTTVWKTEDREVKSEETSKYIRTLKDEFSWLKEVHSKALQQSVLDLNTAMKNCFQIG